MHASDNVALCYFNPCSLVGATRSWSANLSRRSYFNPRSLAGATALNISSACLHRLFQSTLPYGSDRYPRRKHCGAGYFNPRSLTGATAEYAPGRIKVKVFQSTLPYGSDSEYTEDSCLKLRISIHAPLRERLDFYWPSFAHLGISIHAPLRERRDISQLRVISGNFNPRSLTGATSP